MPIERGAPVVLLGPDGNVHYVLAGEPLRDGSDAVLPTTAAVGAEPGTRIGILGTEYTIAHPLWTDVLSALSRGPQIMPPETAAMAAHIAGLSPGSRVVEGGTGSGCATLVMAAHVGREGHVDTFDVRPASTDIARSNIGLAGLADRVAFHVDDVTNCEVTGADAMLLDIPEPWAVLDTAARVIRPGGTLVSYLPTTTQVERLMRSIGADFTGPTCRETIPREWVLSRSDSGLRPSFNGLAHTGFLVHARRI